MKHVSKQLQNSLLALTTTLGCLSMAWAGVPASYEGPKPDLKIESANHTFAEKYPLQYQSWAATKDSEQVDSALEEDPRMVVLWGGIFILTRLQQTTRPLLCDYRCP